MKKMFLILSSLSLLGAACDQPKDHKVAKDRENTGLNTRDSSGNTLTSGDQSETSADRTVTQNVRQAIVSDNSLTALAKNIKIITKNGVVTLRGPVNTDREKQTIGNKVMQVPGVIRVDNQLEVSASSSFNNNNNAGSSYNNRGSNSQY